VIGGYCVQGATCAFFVLQRLALEYRQPDTLLGNLKEFHAMSTFRLNLAANRPGRLRNAYGQRFRQ
jgi:hypothetical protein